jgi:hypothetical protein
MPIEPIPPANIFFPNRFANHFLYSLEVVMGKKGIAGALQAANLAHLIENYPPENDERSFDYATFSMLNAGLEAFIGRRLGRGFARRAGRHMLEQHFVPATGASRIILNLLQKLSSNLPMRAILLSITNQIEGYQPRSAITLHDTGDWFVVSFRICPACWGRAADNSPGTGANEPLCDAIVGMYEGALWRISNGQKYRVTQTSCMAQGEPVCTFQIAKVPFAV